MAEWDGHDDSWIDEAEPGDTLHFKVANYLAPVPEKYQSALRRIFEGQKPLKSQTIPGWRGHFNYWQKAEDGDWVITERVDIGETEGVFYAPVKR